MIKITQELSLSSCLVFPVERKRKTLESVVKTSGAGGVLDCSFSAAGGEDDGGSDYVHTGDHDDDEEEDCFVLGGIVSRSPILPVLVPIHVHVHVHEYDMDDPDDDDFHDSGSSRLYCRLYYRRRKYHSDYYHKVFVPYPYLLSSSSSWSWSWSSYGSLVVALRSPNVETMMMMKEAFFDYSSSHLILWNVSFVQYICIIVMLKLCCWS